MQEVYRLIKSLAWSNVCRHKKDKSPAMVKFRAACNRRSTIYNLATNLSLCAGLSDVTKTEMEHFMGRTHEEQVEFYKELLVAIDHWTARSFMCVRCRSSVEKRQYCEC